MNTNGFPLDGYFMPSNTFTPMPKVNDQLYYQEGFEMCENNSHDSNIDYFNQTIQVMPYYGDQGLSSPESMTFSSPVTPMLSPTITEQINTLPESFLPEFHQYSKETYESGMSQHKKRKFSTKKETADEQVRRQIHIQSEQKRRAQIKDGFEELRQHLPGCINKKMSKAALLHQTVQHLQHLKRNQNSLLSELDRIMKENEQLKKCQSFYPIGI